MNTIRSELNASGGDYGQRLDYRATPVGGNAYMPFSRTSKESIILGISLDGRSVLKMRA
ncbi:MAG: hypothetical protein LBI82_01030 [Dysgonamonadaceae bacterium]|jgi:hypothetical protein|nr:hypothetical protein [Dysgonamonadaceae bacterium]